MQLVPQSSVHVGSGRISIIQGDTQKLGRAADMRKLVIELESRRAWQEENPKRLGFSRIDPIESQIDPRSAQIDVNTFGNIVNI